MLNAAPGNVWDAVRLALVAVSLVTTSIVAAQQGPALPASLPRPVVQENATIKLADHTYVIPAGNVTAVANIGMIVGSKASLVMESGLGPRNGQAIARELAKVSRNSTIYVAATHFHPEHMMGESAFPATATIIRSRMQQQDIDGRGEEVVKFFNSRPEWAEYMTGATFRPFDILFDGDMQLDLGGVRVLFISLGPAHTRGDVGLFVYGDNIVFTGDVAMNNPIGFNTTSAFSSAPAKAVVWLASLERLAALHPVRVVPSHGPLGDANMIQKHLDVMRAVRGRVTELKSQGKSSDETAQLLRTELEPKYAEWAGPNRIPNVAKAFYAELP